MGPLHSASFKIETICASEYRDFFSYIAKKILVFNTTIFRGDYRSKNAHSAFSISNRAKSASSKATLIQTSGSLEILFANGAYALARTCTTSCANQ
jgi:hypothetical protein